MGARRPAPACWRAASSSRLCWKTSGCCRGRRFVCACAVDTNILIYAHRSESRLHEVCHQRLRQLAEGGDLWALPVFCIAEFVRVVTHLRVFTPPTDLSIALEYMRRLVESPTLRLLLPGPTFLDLFIDSCQEAGVRGNLAFNAQIATVCREHGVARILTADRDFARFPGLEPNFVNG